MATPTPVSQLLGRPLSLIPNRIYRRGYWTASPKQEYLGFVWSPYVTYLKTPTYKESNNGITIKRMTRDTPSIDLEYITIEEIKPNQLKTKEMK